MNRKSFLILFLLVNATLIFSQFRIVSGSGTSAKVGINNNSPTQAFNVIGRVGITQPNIYSDEKYNGSIVISQAQATAQYINLVRSGSMAWSIGTVYNTPNFAIGASNQVESQFTSPFFTINAITGYVGIGTSNPATKLHVNGVITCYNFTETNSDIRLKSNVQSSNFGLNEVMKLRPVTYNIAESMNSTKMKLNQIGLIAQEVREVLPTLVSESNDESKLLSLNYISIIPVLVKAIQEQQAQIENQQAQIEKLSKSSNNL